MFKKILLRGFLFLCILAILPNSVFATAVPVAQKHDIFTYVIENDEVTITNVDDVRKLVLVPEKIDGFPVTTLAGGAFGGSIQIKEVTIPDSVTDIGSMCFSYCTELTSVKLPNNIKTLENGIFNHCSKLRTIEIPDSVTLIEKDAFYRCDELWTITIPSSVTSIGKNAFASCPNLSAATIPGSVQEIEVNAFEKNDGFRIYAKPNSTGADFALENDIAYEELITVSVNGEEIVFDQPPITDTLNFRTLVPMRSVIEAIGGKVTWNNNTETTGITLPDYKIEIRIGESFMKVNGIESPLSSCAIEYNHRTLLPIRDVVEAIGGSVSWDEDTKHITISIETNLYH